MYSEQIFSIALGFQTPWEIKEIDFQDNMKVASELHLTIRFKKDSKFNDSDGNE